MWGAPRVGCRGLRPGTLPHHRTYGFPYPALGPGGLPAGREIRRHHKSIALQIAFRQGRVHHPLRRDKPSATTRRHIAQHLLGYPQAPQGAAATPHAVPAQPEALPDVAPNPALQPKDRAPVLDQPVVSPPADNPPPPLVSQLYAGHAAAVCAKSEPTWHDPAWRPCATSPPQGSVRGASGNRRPYRDHGGSLSGCGSSALGPDHPGLLRR